MESRPSEGREFVSQVAAELSSETNSAHPPTPREQLDFQETGPACDADWLVLRKRAARLLESLYDIPRILLDKKGWENDKEAVFSLFRRGCLDAAGNGMLEAPIYSNRRIEDAWTFLLEIARKHPNREKHIQECTRQLGRSYNWCLVLRGSKQVRAVLQELPKALQYAILECANCLDLLELLECSWSSPPPVKASVQTFEMDTPFPAPSWQSEEAIRRAAQTRPDADGFPSGTASAPLSGVPLQNSEAFGASVPDTWAQWEANVARLPTQAVPNSGPCGRNPVRPASETGVGITASPASFNGSRSFGSSSRGGTTPSPWPAGVGTATASRSPQLTNPFAAAVSLGNSPQATSFPMPRDTRNPFKERGPDSQGKPRRKTSSVGASPASRTVSGGAVPISGMNWTNEGTQSRPSPLSAF